MKDAILEIAKECLSDEEIKDIVKEKFKNAIEKAVEDSFKWGDINNTIQKKIKETMVPFIEGYNFDEYIPKLDSVLTEIVNTSNCTADKRILENFKGLCTSIDVKEMKITDIFKEWIKYCNSNIETSGLDVVYEGSVRYEDVDCNMTVDIEERPSWGNFTYATVTFENEHDANLNLQFHLYKYDADCGGHGYRVNGLSKEMDINSLRYLNDIKLLLLRLERSDVDIIIDSEYENDVIVPEDEPEAHYE